MDEVKLAAAYNQIADGYAKAAFALKSEPDAPATPSTSPSNTDDAPSTSPQAPSSSAIEVPKGKPRWLGGWNQDVWKDVYDAVDAAKGATVLFVGYNIPGRDNGNYSAGGLGSAQEFYDWYGRIAAAIGSAPAWVILEPDALGLSLADNFPTDKRQERYDMLAGAVKGLKANPNVKVFADASRWIDPVIMASLLKRLPGIDGFSVNVSGYEETLSVMTWADDVHDESRLGYIIDTSRNGAGNPHPPAWCNVTDARVGAGPTNNTGNPNCLAFVHAKVVGESDGKKINGWDQDGKADRSDVPNAGEPWPEYLDAITSGQWDAFHSKYGA